jgi:hypothetical protein
MDPERRPVRLVDGREREGAVVRSPPSRTSASSWCFAKGADETAYVATTLEVGEGETITHVRLGRTDHLAAATDRGGLYLWELGSEIRLVDNRSLAPAKVTALAWANADISLLVGDDQGGIAALLPRAPEGRRPRAVARARSRLREAERGGGRSRALGARQELPRHRRRRLAAPHPSHVRAGVASLSPPEAPIAHAFIAPKSDGVARHPRGWPHRALRSRRALIPRSPAAFCSARPGTRATRSPSTSGSPPAPPTSSSPSSAWSPSSSGRSRPRSTPCSSPCPSPSWPRSTPRSSRIPPSGRRSNPRSRSWPRCRAWWSVSSPDCGSRPRVEQHIVPVLLMMILLPALGTSGVLFWGAPAAQGPHCAFVRAPNLRWWCPCVCSEP